MYAAGDYPRFGIQEAIGLRLGLLLLAAAVLDTLLDRVRQPASHAKAHRRTPPTRVAQ